MIPLLAPIVTMLAGKGMDALGNLVSNGADAAIDLISEKTGIDLKTTQTLTPEQEQALRDYDLQLKTLDLDREKAYLTDRADARDMQKEALKQSDPFSKRFIYWFSALWSAFACLYLLAISFIEIPEGNVRFVDTTIGFLLGTIIASMFAYFYGSSAGSQAKTELMHGAKS